MLDQWEDSFERHSMNMQAQEPAGERLAAVAAYLTFLLQTQIVRGEMAQQTRQAADILREAVRTEESNWAAQAAPEAGDIF